MLEIVLHVIRRPSVSFGTAGKHAHAGVFNLLSDYDYNITSKASQETFQEAPV